MSRFDELRMVVRRLAARVAVLEDASRPKPKPAPPRPDDADMDEREKLAADYVEAEMMHGGGRVNPKRWKAFFAELARVEERALRRFLSRRDKRPIRKGSGQYMRIRDALLSTTAALKNHGTGKVSHVFRVRRAG
jgi:hypothetical protein